MFVTGLVLAAGGSRRLGQPKQLLAYRGTTLLEYVLDTARGCGFDQLVVALGGAAGAVRRGVDLGGVTVVENDAFGAGCSSSIAAALPALDRRCDLLVLMLGDQPGVTAGTVTTLIDGSAGAALAVCRYDDGRGHPLAFGRAAIPDLAGLHGDKAVWRLLERDARRVTEVPVSGPVPPDVDTWNDYEALVAGEGAAR